ncbi:hypothetical protein BV25DRAFT_1843700 [Artomyces pyxidatus]|uniref:Uncharacterized protein n=1 Tax=Artomyces pyxidatus TaxID=48021 RepID=A0ACB8SD72_9AGAM|nr:hypothetical protein BV25DRAFT_1843700 [Artomyces pyxidatus]
MASCNARRASASETKEQRFAAVAAAKRGDPELRMKIHTIINRRDHNLPGASSGTTTMSTSREMSSPDHELRNDAARYIQHTERTPRIPAPYQDSYDDRLIETFGLTLHRAANEFRCQVNVDGMSTNPTQSARSTEVGGVPFGRDYDASVAGHTVDPRPRSKVSGIASNPTRYSGNGEVERAPPDRAHAPSDVDCIVDHRSGSIADVTMVPHHPAQYSGSTEVGRVPFDRDHALSTCAGGPIVDPHSGSNADVAMLSRDSAQYLGDVEVEKVLSGCDPAAGHTVDPCPPSDVIGIATNPTQYSGSTEVTAQTDKAERVPFDRHAAEQPVLQVSNSSPHGEIRGRQGDAVTSQATESMSQYMVSDEEFDKMELLYPESDLDQDVGNPCLVGTRWALNSLQHSTELAEGDTQIAVHPVQPDTACGPIITFLSADPLSLRVCEIIPVGNDTLTPSSLDVPPFPPPDLPPAPQPPSPSLPPPPHLPRGCDIEREGRPLSCFRGPVCQWTLFAPRIELHPDPTHTDAWIREANLSQITAEGESGMDRVVTYVATHSAGRYKLGREDDDDGGSGNSGSRYRSSLHICRKEITRELLRLVPYDQHQGGKHYAFFERLEFLPQVLDVLERNLHTTIDLAQAVYFLLFFPSTCATYMEALKGSRCAPMRAGSSFTGDPF